MSKNETNPGRPSATLLACRLYPRTWGRGVSYLSGRLGEVRVLVMPKPPMQEGDHSHLMLFTAAPEREAER
jgi:hypothetical protein